MTWGFFVCRGLIERHIFIEQKIGRNEKFSTHI